VASSVKTLETGALPRDTADKPPLRLAMVAGESSGDLLGSRVIRALRAAFPDRELIVEGIGGAAMQAQGLVSLYPMERLSVMGLVEPLGRLPELLRIRRELRRRWLAKPPQLFLGVDAPDFNLGLAKRLRAGGLCTAQLVSPTVWAWRPGRVHAVARAVDSLLCLFPFEPRYYQGLDVRAHYVGHPLVREFADVPDQATARAALGLDRQAPVFALLPGSRGAEVAQLGPTMVAAAKLLHARDPRRRFVMPAASPERWQQCQTLLDDAAAGNLIELVNGRSREAMIAADVVLLASGTATFEAMLLRRPMVISYRVAPLSWALMSRLVVTPYTGLPNILAGERLVPELLQDDLTPPALALEAETLLRDGRAQVDALAPQIVAMQRDFDSAVAQALRALLES
jgi:lipid-A-disaccharide synthase